MAVLRARGASVRLGGRDLLRDADLSLEPGEMVALLGPNGAGKTTFLRAALGLLPLSGGTISLDGRETGALSPSERARRVAYLPQRRPLAWPNRVRDLVALGRFAFGVTPDRLRPADAAAVERALAACGLESLSERTADTLSGGESALVHCARMFAAEAPLALADEPAASLDPAHQRRIMRLLRRFVDDGGGALVVLHEVALAARYADRIVWMRGGRILGGGPPKDAVTPEALRAVYDVSAEIEWRGGALLLTLDG